MRENSTCDSLRIRTYRPPLAPTCSRLQWVELDPASWVWLDLTWEQMQQDLGLPERCKNMRRIIHVSNVQACNHIT